MANPKPQVPDLRTIIDEAVVHPLFNKVRPTITVDSSVPEIVFRHRCRRAYDRILDALVSRGSPKVPPELRKELLALLRQWAATSLTDGFERIEEFELRCAREHDRVVAAESGDREHLLEILEEQYRQQVIMQFGHIELRGIQTPHRILQNLDEVYIPLHLEEFPQFTKDKEDNISVLFPGPKREIAEILNEHRQILVIGAPGSGKSTLVAYLATQLASRHSSFAKNRASLPLVLTVRTINKPALTAQNLADHVGCEREIVERALQQNAFLFIDGLDEAPQELRERLMESLQRFLLKHPTIHIMVTSRSIGTSGELEKRMQGLRPFRLTNLSSSEVDTFIDKWCLAAEKSVHFYEIQAEREARQASEDLKRRLAASYSVMRIAVNPLLVTILCVVHRFLGQTIPEHRVTLYEKFTDALLYEWDRSKFTKETAISHLDARAKRRLLMGVARRLHEEHSSQITEEALVRHFSEILPCIGRSAGDAKAIVQEISDRSGLLVERQPGFFAFSHLTFQEYLCALEFVTAKHFDELADHYQETWWHEVIVLAAGIPGGDGGEIPRRLLNRRNTQAFLLAVQCLETDTYMPSVLQEKITKRMKAILSEGERGIFALSDRGNVAAPILIKSLRGGNVGLRGAILFALRRIDYDPAIPGIAECIKDMGSEVTVLQGSSKKPWKATIGSIAALVLAYKAQSSPTAKSALIKALSQLPSDDLTNLKKLILDTYWDTDTDTLLKIINELSKPRPRNASSTSVTRTA